MTSRKGCMYMVICFCLLADVLPAPAADKTICADGSFVTVHQDGSLMECTLKDPYFVNGITCRGSSAIRFYSTGDLESCMLAENVTILNTSCKADGQIIFYMDGKLRQCVKYED